MNNFERFLTFSNDKFINDDDSFVYRFTEDEYQVIGVNCMLCIIINLAGTITLVFSDENDSETEKAFETEPSILEIRKFVDDCQTK